QISQNNVTFKQAVHPDFRKISLLLEQRINSHQTCLLTTDITPPIDQLASLADKLDLTDTTPAQFDILITALAMHFRHNQTLHIPQGLNRAEVCIFAIDKGTDQLH